MKKTLQLTKQSPGDMEAVSHERWQVRENPALRSKEGKSLQSTNELINIVFCAKLCITTMHYCNNTVFDSL